MICPRLFSCAIFSKYFIEALGSFVFAGDFKWLQNLLLASKCSFLMTPKQIHKSLSWKPMIRSWQISGSSSRDVAKMLRDRQIMFPNCSNWSLWHSGWFALWSVVGEDHAKVMKIWGGGEIAAQVQRIQRKIASARSELVPLTSWILQEMPNNQCRTKINFSVGWRSWFFFFHSNHNTTAFQLTKCFFWAELFTIHKLPSSYSRSLTRSLHIVVTQCDMFREQIRQVRAHCCCLRWYVHWFVGCIWAV